jgi:sulfur carrier protein
MSEAAAPPAVLVNGAPLPWRDGLSVAAVLADRGDPREAVTTALNGRFVPRDAREHTLLAPGDALTLFHAIVGG